MTKNPKTTTPAKAGETIDISEIAKRIRARTASAVIDSGRDLQRVKDLLDHGEFQTWLRDEVQMEYRTAQNYMVAARYVGSLKEPESEMVSLLPPASLYLLARKSTSENARKKVIADLKGGKAVTHADVETAVKGKQTDGKPRRAVRQTNNREAATADLCIKEFEDTIAKVQKLDADTQCAIGEVMINKARDLGDTASDDSGTKVEPGNEAPPEPADDIVTIVRETFECDLKKVTDDELRELQKLCDTFANDIAQQIKTRKPGSDVRQRSKLKSAASNGDAEPEPDNPKTSQDPNLDIPKQFDRRIKDKPAIRRNQQPAA